MAPPRKKLIEVALPLQAINAAAVREKSIRHGHPSTLHLWWARRPLAACRAVLFAQLVDDPSARPDKSVVKVAWAARRAPAVARRGVRRMTIRVGRLRRTTKPTAANVSFRPAQAAPPEGLRAPADWLIVAYAAEFLERPGDTGSP